jgi:C-terminal processing protease CtpA/Prc
MFSLVLSSFLFISCSDDDEVNGGANGVTLNNPINKFVWEGMNSWYNWQENVPNLSDDFNNNTEDFYNYLNGFSSPEGLFESLLFDAGNTDRFSWFIEDYVEQQKQFQGISVSTGIRRSVPIGIGNNQIIIYAQYVSPNSPAYAAGIRRGDIINAIDNEVMNETNYASVINKLYSGETINVRVSTENGGILTEKATYSITPTEFPDNPVFVAKTFDNINGKKVGYLTYNSFRSSYNDELNAAFEIFETEGINELVLDLRINGGGSVETSAYLASMIYENAGNQVFAELNFNEKHNNQNGVYNFENTLNVYNAAGSLTGTQAINRLSTINRLYVLTSGSTASASEMIINGLKPFIEVITIGTTTYGKNVGSITLYDSPSSDYTNSASANSSHLNAMQPIVFQIFNKDGESDYTQGFQPNTEVEEWRFWASILPFGDENEILLKTALDHMRGISSKSTLKQSFVSSKKNEEKIKKRKFENEMYIDSFNLNK